jgi:hypothetical protein
MSFVVDKMSLRHAPASLVTFCGKATAYAFFFVPGIAEILVRIWKLQAETLRRTADELGLPRRPSKADMDEVVASFPAHIQSLGWSSVKSMSAKLRQRPDLPIVAEKIPWYGPWVARWCGRDSDLFFVFVKHYHILAEDFLPSGLSLDSKARSPGTSAHTVTATTTNIFQALCSSKLKLLRLWMVSSTVNPPQNLRQLPLMMSLLEQMPMLLHFRCLRIILRDSWLKIV